MAESTAFARRGLKGGVASTTLNGALNNSATTITCTDLSTWTGVTTNGPATATIARGAADEEVIEFTGISGSSLTGVTRGVGGTSAQSHSSGVAIEHTSQKRDYDEANNWINQLSNASTTAGDIPYATAANTITRLGIGTANQPLTTNAGATAPVWGGTVNHGDNLVVRALLKDYGEEVHAHGNTGSTETLDIENGNVHTVTLDANCTLTFSNPTATGDCCSFTLVITQDATGSRTITWPASVDWAAATAPTLSTGANDVDIITFLTVDAGTRWYGMVGGKDFG